MVTSFANLAEFQSAVGKELGVSAWTVINQERIDAFAAVTGDFQWIHVDRKRAGSSPFGGTIAHGYLLVSLLPAFALEIYEIREYSHGVNYGSNRVRFPAPVPVDSRVRASARLTAAEPVATGIQFTITFTIELEGSSKPACVAEVVYVLTQ